MLTRRKNRHYFFDSNAGGPNEDEAHFLHFDSTIKGHGAERLEIAFVLFVHSSDRQRQGLLGYCVWSPTIIVV
ncbi:hypothetical protein WJ78_28810 [Burkholderia ubonensis]|uniref:AidA/PixA family protein n=1 Tax=Burkholderia ubonensis TaxID=101571 RepID=UPI00075327AE|nr:AidA/PixA family protein [Burkholderia ubonensis]KVO57377.1 hypothetical protein WJ78_28810 [Burkholderia ubonensis]KVP94329.1 hypothetical protein WJ97_17605 [Burkholderia ubonensis]